MVPDGETSQPLAVSRLLKRVPLENETRHFRAACFLLVRAAGFREDLKLLLYKYHLLTMVEKHTIR